MNIFYAVIGAIGLLYIMYLVRKDKEDELFTTTFEKGEMKISLNETALSNRIKNNTLHRAKTSKMTQADIAGIFLSKQISKSEFDLLYGVGEFESKYNTIALMKGNTVLFKHSFDNLRSFNLSTHGKVIVSANKTSRGIAGLVICYDKTGKEIFSKKPPRPIDYVWISDTDIIAYNDIWSKLTFYDMTSQKVLKRTTLHFEEARIIYENETKDIFELLNKTLGK